MTGQERKRIEALERGIARWQLVLDNLSMDAPDNLIYAIQLEIKNREMRLRRLRRIQGDNEHIHNTYNRDTTPAPAADIYRPVSAGNIPGD